jgi:phage-related protein
VKALSSSPSTAKKKKRKRKNKLIKISDRENIEREIFFQMFKELMTIFHKIFQKKKEKNTS